MGSENKENKSPERKTNLNSYTVHCFPKDVEKLKKIKEEIKNNYKGNWNEKFKSKDAEGKIVEETKNYQSLAGLLLFIKPTLEEKKIIGLISSKAVAGVVVSAEK